MALSVLRSLPILLLKFDHTLIGMILGVPAKILKTHQDYRMASHLKSWQFSFLCGRVFLSFRVNQVQDCFLSLSPRKILSPIKFSWYFFVVDITLIKMKTSHVQRLEGFSFHLQHFTILLLLLPRSISLSASVTLNVFHFDCMKHISIIWLKKLNNWFIGYRLTTART